ncbi:MAG: hypothetical protein AMK69_04440 [Nitrospira bacterium SG8_3]|nr:MAG: hypothetical protein AMK69_04440 [Nitrospira bacterium SG8_3]
MPHLPGFMGQAATALALQKWAPLFYPDKGEEKYGEVMIHSLGHRLLKAAGRTSPRLTIESHSFRLNTGNEEEHGVFSKCGTD